MKWIRENLGVLLRVCAVVIAIIFFIYKLVGGIESSMLTWYGAHKYVLAGILNGLVGIVVMGGVFAVGCIYDDVRVIKAKTVYSEDVEDKFGCLVDKLFTKEKKVSPVVPQAQPQVAPQAQASVQEQMAPIAETQEPESHANSVPLEEELPTL